MSNLIPEDKESIQAEISELLGITPMTSDRCRLFHLLDALSKFGGDGGDNGSTLPAGSLNLGEFVITSDKSSITGGSNNIFASANTLIFSAQYVAMLDQLTFLEYGAQTKFYDHIYNLTIDDPNMGGSFTLHGVNSVVGGGADAKCYVTTKSPSLPTLPPLPDGTKIKLTTSIIPKGTMSVYGVGTTVLEGRVIAADVSTIQDFVDNYFSAMPYDVGIDNTDISAAHNFIIKGATSQGLNPKLEAFDQMNEVGLGANVGAIVEFYQNGEYYGGYIGTVDTSAIDYDQTNNVWAVKLAYRKSIVGSRSITISEDNPASVRIYITGIK